MAYVASDPNQTDQDQDQSQSGQNSSSTSSGSSSPAAASSTNVSGSTASGSGGGNTSQSGSSSNSATPASQYQASQSQSATPSATSSGRFQNLQSYLTANSGYNNGQGLAGQMGSTLSGKEQADQNATTQGAQSTTDAANQAAAQYDPTTTGNYLSQTFADPTKVASDPTAMAQWNNYYNGTYAPTAFDASGSLQNQNNQFQQTAGMTNSESGRMGLLQNLYGTPSYSGGQQNLDNLLLQSQPGQLGQLQSTAGNLSNQLGNAYTAGQTQAGNAITAGQGLAANASAATQAGLTGDISSEQAALQQKAADMNTQRTGQYNTDMQQMQSNQLSPDLMSQLGLTAGTKTYNLDPSSFLTQNATQAGVGNVSTAADAAKFAALAQLSGQDPSGTLGQFATPAAQPMSSVYNFNNAGFNQAQQAAASAYQTAYNAPIARTGSAGTYTLPQLQNYIDGTKAAAVANGGSADPNSWKGSTGDTARQYLAQIAAFNKAQGYGNSIQ